MSFRMSETLIKAWMKAMKIEDPSDPLTLENWHQVTGEYIEVKYMDDTHIDHAIKMLCRQLDASSPALEPDGDYSGSSGFIKRAWIERFTYELAERALGNRQHVKKLSYMLAQIIFRDGMDRGMSIREAANRVARCRKRGRLTELLFEETIQAICLENIATAPHSSRKPG